MSLKVLSLFTGCGGMDIGFEGGFSCFKRSIINKEWVDKDNGDTVIVKKLHLKQFLRMIFVLMLRRHGLIIFILVKI